MHVCFVLFLGPWIFTKEVTWRMVELCLPVQVNFLEGVVRSSLSVMSPGPAQRAMPGSLYPLFTQSDNHCMWQSQYRGLAPRALQCIKNSAAFIIKVKSTSSLSHDFIYILIDDAQNYTSKIQLKLWWYNIVNFFNVNEYSLYNYCSFCT